ncbi:hypothetical protein I4U23_025883 [Adineta vaga]|nr:hypothetical protein I4U23_025883 [Adineta vaga]
MRNIDRKFYFQLIIIFFIFIITIQADSHVFFSNDDDDLEQSVHHQLLQHINLQERFLGSETATSLLITDGSGESTTLISSTSSSITESISPETDLTTDSVFVVTLAHTTIILTSDATSLSTTAGLSLTTASSIVLFTSVLTPNTTLSDTKITTDLNISTEKTSGISTNTDLAASLFAEYSTSISSSPELFTHVDSTSASVTEREKTYTSLLTTTTTTTTSLNISTPAFTAKTPTDSIESTTTITTAISQSTQIHTVSVNTVPITIMNSTITSSTTHDNQLNSTYMSPPTTAKTNISVSYNTDKCNSSTPVYLSNDTCTSKEAGINIALDILNSTNTTDNQKADAFILYFDVIKNPDPDANLTGTFTIQKIDEIITSMDQIDGLKNSNSSSIMIQSTKTDNENVFVLGVSVKDDKTGRVVNTQNKNERINNPDLLTAAIVDNQTLKDVTALKILIINDPTSFANADNITNKTIVSSLVVFSVQKINNTNTTINVFLYFKLFNKYTRNDDQDYRCSYYNTINRTWDENGCSPAHYNKIYKRFECHCNHNTTFALIWLPNGSTKSKLEPQDIASLVFQCISILCFIIVIAHGLGSRFCNPLVAIEARLLLPLLSAASTTLLFIFFIALAMTVYTRTPSSNEQPCFLSSTVLMFVTYFLLIFMFCVKTSVGYFNYLRFVYLFPEPSYRRLCFMLLISFFISVACVSLAIGFDSNSSSHITKLYPYRLCWFTRDVIYYFMTIPAGIFLLINVLIMILVGSRIISHVRHATSPHQSYERMKRCVLVLLSSCITQGIGWVFGPSITFVDREAADVLGWLFIIFTCLEGFWTIVLYIIIRSQHMDEQKRVTAQKNLKKSTTISSRKNKERRTMNPERTLSRQLRSPTLQLRKEPKEFKDFNYRKRTVHG